jgi:hypothetical protein
MARNYAPDKEVTCTDVTITIHDCDRTCGEENRYYIRTTRPMLHLAADEFYCNTTEAAILELIKRVREIDAKV